MGNWFSKPIESDAVDQEYINNMNKLKEQEESLQQAIQDAQLQKELISEASLNRQNQISETRMKELEYALTRAEELRDARRLLNIQASQLICAIYYNYQFGAIEDDPNNNWNDNVSSVINKCMSVDSFWLLCKIPQLLPVIWPTGTKEEHFHKYPTDDKGNVNISEYIIMVESYIDAYVTNNLTEYISNICRANCKKNIYVDQTKNAQISKQCKDYINNTETSINDTEWITATMKFIQLNDDKMDWKCLAARTEKGICSSKIRVLPSTFPKISPEYELFEAILMLSNTVINQYGSLRTLSGLMISGDESLTTHTNGGKCFKLNETWIKNNYAKANENLSAPIWDHSTYVNVDDLEVESTIITGRSDWMLDVSTHGVTEVYLKNADGSGGYYKYVNPTQKYTRLFINDEPEIEVALKIPKMSADINDDFKKNALKNMFTHLTTDKNYQYYNVYSHVNRNLFTSMDYLNTTPVGFEQVDNVAPLARYIFEALIQNSCKWNLVIPLEETMNFHKINTTIGDKTHYPQSIWTSMNTSIYKTTTLKKYLNTVNFTTSEDPIKQLLITL